MKQTVKSLTSNGMKIKLRRKGNTLEAQINQPQKNIAHMM